MKHHPQPEMPCGGDVINLKPIYNMKLKTISGETLRAQFTDFECHALKHAAAHCKNGETFTGVPTSSNPKYMGSAEAFTVIENCEESVTIRREKTGLCLTACKCEGSTRATRKAETERPERPERPERKEEATTAAKPATSGNPAEMLTAAIQALAGGVTPAAIQALQEEVAALKEEVAALKDEKPSRTIEVKVDGKVNRVDGVLNPVFEDVVALIAAKKNVYLFGPAGSGKNVLCSQVAEAFGLKFYYQNTLLTKFDLSGFKNAVGDFEKTEFFEAFTQGGLFMLDEVDNSSAEALVALNAALANGYYSFPGIGRVDCHPDFRCIAAGNTIGTGADAAYCGRYKMDASSRDRFQFIEVDYCPDIEESICKGHDDVLQFVRDLRKAVQKVCAEIICGYRCMSSLVQFGEKFGEEKSIKYFITNGIEKADRDTIREIQRALKDVCETQNAWHSAFLYDI